jgi:hypothetical protein
LHILQGLFLCHFQKEALIAEGNTGVLSFAQAWGVSRLAR